MQATLDLGERYWLNLAYPGVFLIRIPHKSPNCRVETVASAIKECCVAKGSEEGKEMVWKVRKVFASGSLPLGHPQYPHNRKIRRSIHLAFFILNVEVIGSISTIHRKVSRKWRTLRLMGFLGSEVKYLTPSGSNRMIFWSNLLKHSMKDCSSTKHYKSSEAPIIKVFK